MLLKFQLDDSEFRIVNPDDVNVQASLDYIRCHFDIKSSMWSGMDALCAVFKNLTFNKYDQVMLDSNHNCYINPDLFRRGGTIDVKLVGDKYLSDGVRSTTHQTGIVVLRINDGVVIPVRVPDKYDVFLAEYEIASQNVQNVIDDLTTKVADGFFNGEDGVSITNITYASDGKVTVFLSDGSSFTSADSMRGAPFTYSDFTPAQLEGLKGPQGSPGRDGSDGDDGRGITSISKTGTSGLVDTYTITYTDGTTSTYTVTNGRDGHDGVDGDVDDVQINGASILSNNVANITNFSGQSTSSLNNKAGLVPKPPAIGETGQWHILTDGGWIEASPQEDSLIPWARKYSPAFTGTPTAPTAATGTSTTQLATTEFVANTVGAMTSGVSDVKVNNASVVSDGIASIPKATDSQWGVLKIRNGTNEGNSAYILGICRDSGWDFVPKLSAAYKISTNCLPDATTTAKGAMSAADKTKLDSITLTNGVIDASCLPVYNGGVS